MDRNDPVNVSNIILQKEVRDAPGKVPAQTHQKMLGIYNEKNNVFEKIKINKKSKHVLTVLQRSYT